MSGPDVAGVGSRHEHWRGVLAQQVSSGLSIKQFCLRERIAHQTFHYWKKRLVAEGVVVPRTFVAAGFVPVRVTEEAPAPAREAWVEIALPSGRVVRVHGSVDRALLADILAVVEAPPAAGAAAC